MAHGNQNNDNNEDNPFSFKKFITKQNDTLINSNIINTNNNNNQNSLLNNHSHNNSDNDDDLLIFKSRDKSLSSNISTNNINTSNPFSFRQFLNETNKKSSKITNKIKNNENDESISDDIEDDDFDEILLPNITKNNDSFIHQPPIPPLLPPPPLSPPINILNKSNPYLPDFINESLLINDNNDNDKISSSVKTNDKVINHHNGINIENPYLVLENIPNISPLSTSPSQVSIIPPIIPLSDIASNTSIISNNSYFDLESKLPLNNIESKKVNKNKKFIDSQSIPSYFDLETNLSDKILQVNSTAVNNKSEILNDINDVNLKLNKQLIEKQIIIDEQQKKLQIYEKQLNEIKMKEDQETKTLENIILHIEKNLEETTKRAIEAENIVDKLKLENKGLKLQVQNLLNENELFKLNNNNNNNSSNLRDILSNHSNQLNQAALSGEQLIKQLLNGVDTLKLLAQSIESIGKIQEMNNDIKK